MHKPIFLHIGTHKTGTSSIQHYLSKNAPALRRRGIVVPAAAGSVNHYNVPLFALSDEDLSPLRFNHSLVTPEAVVDFRNALLASIKAEAATWTEQEAIVLSSEHLMSLRDPGEFDRLKALLTTMGPRPVRIVIYLRRQDAYYVSAYAQHIKGGSTAPWLSQESFDHLELDYGLTLARWESAFGRDSLCVRVFEGGQLTGGDAIADFMSVIGCDGLDNFQVMKNVSLDARSTEFLRRINPWFPRFTENQPNLQRRALLHALTRLSTGPRLRLDRPSAMKLLAQYEESNARIAREYLGRADGRLFRESPPDQTEQPPALSIDEATEISSQLWSIANGIWTDPEEERQKKRKARRLASMTPDQRRALRRKRQTRLATH